MNFVAKEDAALIQQQSALQTQQATLTRLIPLFFVSVACCVIMCVIGVVAYRSLNTKMKNLTSAPPPSESIRPSSRVVIQKDTIVIRDTIVRASSPRKTPRKAPKLWYME